MYYVYHMHVLLQPSNMYARWDSDEIHSVGMSLAIAAGWQLLDGCWRTNMWTYM